MSGRRSWCGVGMRRCGVSCGRGSGVWGCEIK